jgi:hypothetical protein
VAFQWNADTIILADDWSEIADEEKLIVRILSAAEEADYASLKILAINPLEAG